MSDVVAIPGDDRVIRFKIGDLAFGFRRPSQGDDFEANKRTIQRLTVPVYGPDGRPQSLESPMLDGLDGRDRMWASRLEIGLRPRRNDPALSLGETAPEHWTVEVTPTGVARMISFENVPKDEFAQVVEYLEEALAKKKPPSPLPPSSPAAARPTDV